MHRIRTSIFNGQTHERVHSHCWHNQQCLLPLQFKEKKIRVYPTTGNLLAKAQARLQLWNFIHGLRQKILPILLHAVVVMRANPVGTVWVIMDESMVLQWVLRKWFSWFCMWVNQWCCGECCSRFHMTGLWIEVSVTCLLCLRWCNFLTVFYFWNFGVQATLGTNMDLNLIHTNASPSVSKGHTSYVFPLSAMATSDTFIYMVMHKHNHTWKNKTPPGGAPEYSFPFDQRDVTL